MAAETPLASATDIPLSQPISKLNNLLFVLNIKFIIQTKPKSCAHMRTLDLGKES